MVSGGTKCVKWLIFVFNFIFFLTGCGLIGLGVWLNVERDDWQDISDYDYISVANLVIAAGVIIVIVAFLGCCGAITENKIMLLIFFIFLFVIFILELAAGIAAYVMHDEVEDEIKKQLRERIPSRYYKEDGIKKAMNLIQDHFDCCGIDGINDWSETVMDKDGKPQSSVDRSCCKDDVRVCLTQQYEVATTLPHYNLQGCEQKIEDFIEDNLLYVGLTGIIFAVFQIIGMVFAMVLYCAIRKEGQTV